MRATLNHSGVSMKIADMKLTMAGQEQGLEILREENAQLRAALERFVTAAKSWHNFHHGSQTVQCDWLCECIAPGERALAGIPEQGSSAAECEAHNLEVAGATPAPASIQAPIVRVTINDQYEISSCAQYAPGLPPGDHDLYCEPGGFGSNSSAEPE